MPCHLGHLLSNLGKAPRGANIKEPKVAPSPSACFCIPLNQNKMVLCATYPTGPQDQTHLLLSGSELGLVSDSSYLLLTVVRQRLPQRCLEQSGPRVIDRACPLPSVLTDHSANAPSLGISRLGLPKQAGSLKHRGKGQRRKGSTGYATVPITTFPLLPPCRQDEDRRYPAWTQAGGLHFASPKWTPELSDLVICRVEQGGGFFICSNT